MGFSSAGRDQGSTFYFELPLYSAASIGLDPEQAARTMLLSQNRLATAPMAHRRPLEWTGEMKTSSRRQSVDTRLLGTDRSSSEVDVA